MIRRARPDDAEAVVRIFHESRAEAMPWLPLLHTHEEDLGWFGALARPARRGSSRRTPSRSATRR